MQYSTPTENKLNAGSSGDAESLKYRMHCPRISFLVQTVAYKICNLAHFSLQLVDSTLVVSAIESPRHLSTSLRYKFCFNVALLSYLPSTIKHGIQILPQLFNTPTSSSTEYSNCMQG